MKGEHWIEYTYCAMILAMIPTFGSTLTSIPNLYRTLLFLPYINYCISTSTPELLVRSRGDRSWLGRGVTEYGGESAWASGKLGWLKVELGIGVDSSLRSPASH